MSILNYDKSMPATKSEIGSMSCERCDLTLNMPPFSPQHANTRFMPFDFADSEPISPKPEKSSSDSPKEVEQEKDEEGLKDAGSEGKEKDDLSQFVRLNVDEKTVYEGELKDCEMHGHGKLFVGDSLLYAGELHHNVFHGYGVLTNDGSSLEGNVAIAQVRKGQNLNFFGWLSYEGTFRDNKREGKGCLKFNQSDKFIGEFINDEAEGLGLLIGQEGTLSGIWSKGVLLKELNFSQA